MSGGAGDAVRTMALIVLITFVVETAIMVLLSLLRGGGDPLALALVDALLLALLIAPPIYWLVRRPIRSEHQRRLLAESEAGAARRLAQIDSLTGILNRRAILWFLRDSHAAAERYGHPLSVALIDVDAFKAINDSHGHDAGDRALQDLVSIVGGSLRAADKIGRWGGDEFLVVLPNSDVEATHALSDRLRALVYEHGLAVGEQVVELSVSIGATELQPGESCEQMLLRVDRALYEAKESGRNRVVSSRAAQVSNLRA